MTTRLELFVFSEIILQQINHLIIHYSTDFRTQLPRLIMADSAMDGGHFAHNNTVAPKEEKILPLFSNKGKTAIVSGAGAGIGLAVAQGLAESGANVAIWYNSNKKAVARAEAIEKEYGVKCKYCSMLALTIVG